MLWVNKYTGIYVTTSFSRMSVLNGFSNKVFILPDALLVIVQQDEKVPVLLNRESASFFNRFLFFSSNYLLYNI